MELEKYSNRKSFSRYLSEIYRNSGVDFLVHKADRVKECCDWLKFRVCESNLKHKKLVRVNLCKDKLCPNDMKARALKMTAKLLPVLKNQKLKIFKMELTIKNKFSISNEDVKYFWSCHKKFVLRELVKRVHFRDGRNIFMGVVKGGISHLEIGWSKEKGFHPHFHLILIASGFLDYKIMSASWKDITGDSYRIWIRQLAKDDYKGFVDGIKYCIKFDQLERSPPALVQLAKALYRVRLFNSFGSLRNLLSAIEEDMKSYNEKKILNKLCDICGHKTAIEIYNYINQFYERMVIK